MTEPDRFHLVGTGTFLDHTDIPTRIYEWHDSDAPLLRDFAIRLVLPQDGPPRHFYVEPQLISLLDRSNPAHEQFLKQACAIGYRLLSDYEHHGETESIAHGMYAALFRHRHAGHLAIRRKFASAQDFVDFSSDQPTLITPGLDAAFLDPLDESSVPTGVNFQDHRAVQARKLVAQAIAKATGGRVCSVRQYYQTEFMRDCPSWPPIRANVRSLALDQLPHRSILDRFFTDGTRMVAADFDWFATETAVRQALIGGPSSRTDFERIDEAARLNCIDRFVTQFCNRTPTQFDVWLVNMREHGCLQLVRGGTRMAGAEREQARELGTTLYCWMLWQAYQHMARCYGALFLVVGLHLSLEAQLAVSDVEEKIFRSFHLPQTYLAGLPLAFFRPEQLSWIIAPIQALRSEGRFDAAAYTGVTNLLGVLGMLVRDRRAADRRRKAGQEHIRDDLEVAASASDSVSEFELPRVLWDGLMYCPNCGTRLFPFGCNPTATERLEFSLGCCGCDREFHFYCDPAALQTLLGT